MKKHLTLTALITILSIKSYSQIVFENGYIINESDQKINCLIKNIDWKDNPTEFEFKISQDEAIQNGTIQTVKEFGINGVSKYIRAKVQIDRSSNELSDLSRERNPIFREEELFLKVLVEGKASLYIYESGNLTRYFYKTNDSAISQLVHKNYISKTENVVENNFFRQQLFNDLKCEGITSHSVENIKYYRKDLEKLFLKFNECTNSAYVNYELSQKKDQFNLSLRPGINFSTLSMQNSQINQLNIDFGNELNFRFGIEAELILPFNKNKWGLIIEPTYQYYKVTQSTNTTNNPKANYQSIELPFGVRHYFYFNDKSKIFINASFVLDFSNSSSTVEYTTSTGSSVSTLHVKSGNNLAFGGGYKFKNRYSVEMRYLTSREIFNNSAFWSSDYKTFSIIFGYTLF